MPTQSSAGDGFVPAAPGDSLDEARGFARVSAGLFGEGNAAPMLGRYYLLEKIGQGGMGVVYSAYDPTLERKVALKLLRDRGDAGRQLIEEGRALANLDHPNIVTVHEVGECARGAFLAMSFIKGGNLAVWLNHTECGWRVRLSLLLDAARGLAAAHSAGVIHRDFKPSNVIVGEDGSVRIVDFGLAIRDVAKVDSARRQTRAGTSGYMAPEQIAGETVGAAADQYAFCVALVEALLGRRLRDDEVPESAAWHRQSRAREQEAGSNQDFPTTALFETLARGMRLQPCERFADMEALVAQIEADTRKRPSRWRWLVPTLAVVSLAGLVALGLRGVLSGDVDDPCLNVATEIADGWSDARRARVTDYQLRGSSQSSLSASWRQGLLGLDNYAAEWSNARVSSCRAYHLGGESAELFDARTECLARLRGRVEELGRSLENNQLGDGTSVYKAVNGLQPIGSCQAPASLFLLPLRPDNLADRKTSADLIGQIEDGRQKRRLGLPTDPGLATKLEAIVDGLADLSVRAEARRYLAGGAKTVAEELRLRRTALADAVAARDARLVEAIHVEIGYVLLRMGRFDDAAANFDLADAQLTALDAYASEYPPIVQLNAERRGAVLAARANQARSTGDHENSARYNQLAVDSYLRLDNPKPLRVAPMLNNIGESNRLRARFEPAIAAYTRAIELASTVAGPRDFQLVTLYNNRGSAYMDMGQLAEAESDLWRARGDAQQIREFGELLAEINLAMVKWLRGQHVAALDGCELAHTVTATGAIGDFPLLRAWVDVECEAYRVTIFGERAELALLNDKVETLRRVGAAEKTLLALGLLRHATIMVNRGRLGPAARSLDEAAEALRVPGEIEKVEMAVAYHQRGRLFDARGDAVNARRQHQRALASLEAKGLGKHPFAVGPLIALTRFEPDPIKAETLLSRATQIVKAQALSPDLNEQINEQRRAHKRRYP